jgi:hypothetical protein
MQQTTKFNYGLLIMGIVAPTIADYFLGKAYGIIVAIIFGVVAVGFLVSGHNHREKSDAPLPRKRRMAAYGLVGVAIALAVMGLRAVYAREFIPKVTTAQSSQPQSLQTGQQSNNAHPQAQSPVPPKKHTAQKTPKSSPKAGSDINMETGKGGDATGPNGKGGDGGSITFTTGNGGNAVGGITQGPGSIAQVGGEHNTATVNNLTNRPDPVFHWEVKAFEASPGIESRPGVTITIWADGMMDVPAFLAFCDRPCGSVNAGTGGLTQARYFSDDGRNVMGFTFITPSSLMRDDKISWKIRSKDARPVSIKSVVRFPVDKIPKPNDEPFVPEN